MKIDANKVKGIVIDGGAGIVFAAIVHAARKGDLKIPEGIPKKVLGICEDVIDANVDNAIETSAE